MMKEIQQRLINAYLRGFRAAVMGEIFSAKMCRDLDAYTRGFVHGQDVLLHAKKTARHTAREIVES